MPQYVVMSYGGIVYGPAATLAAAEQHAYARAYNDAMDSTAYAISDVRLAEVVANFRGNYTIHEVTISPEVTVEGK